MKRGDLLRHLRKHGCHLKREGRSHSLWINPATGAVERTWNQSVGEFLIDREGIVRWLYVEGTTAADYMAKFSSEESLLSAARALPPLRQGE